MGDSITDSWDNPANGGFFPRKPYVNRGISGQTTPQMLIRVRRDVIELKPQVVVILAGTNDLAGNTGPTTLEAIQDNLKSMSELATAHGIRVVFASRWFECSGRRHIVGAGSIHHGDMLRVPLTTVSWSKSEMGQAAASLLLELIDGEKGATPQIDHSGSRTHHPPFLRCYQTFARTLGSS